MTVRERTKCLTTGPGEKLRNQLGLGPEHSGTCAQLARAASRYKTAYHNSANKLPAIEIQLRGLGDAIGIGLVGIGAGNLVIVRENKPDILV